MGREREREFAGGYFSGWDAGVCVCVCAVVFVRLEGARLGAVDEDANF